jgi:DNA polymerase elongation subunit (family B)
MIILMDRNASNASNESLSALYVKSMYDSIMRQHNVIIAEVVKEKPELEILITDALDAPFLVENRQRPGKMHHVEKLVDIWEYYEQVPTLRVGFIGRSCATSLWSYTDTMCRYHSLAETDVTENRSRLRGWKSEPMSDVERARLFLMDGGVELGLQYPSCPRCQHVSTTSLTGHPTMVLLMS